MIVKHELLCQDVIAVVHWYLNTRQVGERDDFGGSEPPEHGGSFHPIQPSEIPPESIGIAALCNINTIFLKTVCDLHEVW